jgi:hypothetical protein
VQPIINELANAPNMDVAQKGKINEQHQNATKLFVLRDPTVLLSKFTK